MPVDVRRRKLRTIGGPVWILGIAQALYFSVVSVDLTVTALAGLSLAPTPALATLPLAAINITGALFSYPAGYLAGRYGYKPVLIGGAVIAVVGALVSVMAILDHSFWMLCAGTALMETYRAAGNFIRYWATEYAADDAKARALAVVMYGGLVAAFIGPLAAAFLADAFTPMFLGSFALVVVLCGAAALVFVGVPPLPFLRRGDARGARGARGALPPVRFAEVRGRAQLWIGMIALCATGALMTMVMAVGPLASSGAGHTTEFGGFMIQLHLIGMFAPSIISAWVITRLGAAKTGVIGAIITAVGACARWLSDGHAAMLVALFCSGAGWNLLFLAGTSLIVSTYPTGRGSKIQAVAETASSAVGVLAALSAGLVYRLLGWVNVNVPVLLLAVTVGVLLWWVDRKGRKTREVQSDVAASGEG